MYSGALDKPRKSFPFTNCGWLNKQWRQGLGSFPKRGIQCQGFVDDHAGTMNK